jgi:uncharacterized YigZ family protein
MLSFFNIGGEAVEAEYKTLSKQAVAEYEEKKSKFIATARPVSSEEEAQEFVASLKSKYWDATHNVYAWYIAGDNITQKFSDDGEPSGTAGKPVLEAIKKLEVRDAVVVVTRYFGGTLLGAAGLVRAYGKSATLGLEAAGIIKKQLCIKTYIKIEYSFLGKVQNIIAERGYKLIKSDYGQDVSISLYVPVGEHDGFLNTITEVTNGRATISGEEKEYI